ncbi:MAG TPA: hypothetical protein VGG75_28420 [Trebonia sp.]|jgi:hypothetical protein
MGYTPKHAKPAVNSSAKPGHALFSFAKASGSHSRGTAVAERGARLVPQPRPATD